jgi:hypothetical protein
MTERFERQQHAPSVRIRAPRTTTAGDVAIQERVFGRKLHTRRAARSAGELTAKHCGDADRLRGIAHTAGRPATPVTSKSKCSPPTRTVSVRVCAGTAGVNVEVHLEM